VLKLVKIKVKLKDYHKLTMKSIMVTHYHDTIIIWIYF